MTLFSNRLACASTISAGVLLALLSGCNNAQGTDGAAPATTIGTQIDDSVITTRVRTALMSDEDIKSLDIKVKTDKGAVLLSGFADSQVQIDRDIAVARSIEGVKSVDNQLSLKTGRQTVGNKIDDSVVTARVKSALLGDAAMKSLDVSVTTRKGEVQLSGYVDNPTQQARAMNITSGVEGVVSVANHMSIRK